MAETKKNNDELVFTGEMPYMGQMTESQFDGIKAILAGYSGMGKTRSVMTCPKPVLYITSEKKYASIHPSAMEGMTLTGINNFQEFFNILWQCEHDPQMPQYYKTVFIDSLTDIANMRLKEVKPNFNDARAAYFRTQNDMLQIFRVMRNIKTNVIGICLLDRYLDQENFMKYGPLFPGKELAKIVPSQFDEIYIARSEMIDKGGVHYFYQTVNDGKYECKSCSDVLPAKVEPDWSMIINLIESRSQFFDSTTNSPSY